MKPKDILKTTFALLIMLFLTMYITTMSNYQAIENKKQTTLTEEAIARFEQDVAEGKEIIASNYLTKEKDYDNKISSSALKISNFIEKAYKKTLTKIFKELGNLIEE